MSAERLYHGGAAGLAVGDLIVPNPNGRGHDGCPICEARASGLTVTVDGESIDPPTGHADAVYVTPSRLLARHYAALAGGDLYSVTATGLVPSEEDEVIPAYRCDQATVATVVDRAVRLTNSERRRLWRAMGGTTAEWHRMVSQLPSVMRHAREAQS